MIRGVVLLGLVACLLVPADVLADASDELRAMLAHVPSDAMADGGLVSYVDYRAVESARPGAARPGSTEEWVALRDAGEAPFGLWLAAVRGVTGGSVAFMDAFVTAGEDQPGLMGFDFFDVDRGIHFGHPPGDGVALAGSFDPGAIVAAHATRGFTATEVPGWMLICGAAGCDQGTVTNMQAIERADPFGGFLGRQQPLLASDTTLLSSAVLGTVEAMRAAADGDAHSLADDEAVRIAVDAVGDDALLRQATLVPSAVLLADVGVGIAELAEGLSERDALAPIPPHRLVLLADTATPTEQVVEVILVYASEEEAEEAAAALPGRVEAAWSERAAQTVRELFDARGVTDISSNVYSDPHGEGAAAVLTLRAPLASADLTATPVEASSLPYRLLIDMIVARDTAWLAPSLDGLAAD